MSHISDKLDKALGLNDVDVDDEILTETDDAIIEKHNLRRKKVEALKQTLKDARSMQNKDWAESILKKTIDNLVITQEIFTEEIEDNPKASNVTAQGDIANALTSAVREVMELDREDKRIAISQEKNDLRRMEVLRTGGNTIDSTGKVIGTGSADDLLKALKNGAIDVDTEETENINTTEEEPSDGESNE